LISTAKQNVIRQFHCFTYNRVPSDPLTLTLLTPHDALKSPPVSITYALVFIIVLDL
jgi:hypothetical protein